MIQDLRNKLNISNQERQRLELSFKEQASGMNQKIFESERKITILNQNKEEINNLLEDERNKFKENIQKKNQEIDFLKNNHQILENSKIISQQKIEEFKSNNIII